MQTLLTFSSAALVLLLLPGPAVLYIVTRSASQGWRAGLVSDAGIHAGTVVHIVAAMVGLSAVLAASATAFTVVKLAGAVYLLWLGIQSLRAYRRGSTQPMIAVEHRRLRRVFLDGFVLNVLNPKTAIFFLAFVPQFVDPNAANAAAQLAVLGALFISIGLVTDGAYALAGGWLGVKLGDGSAFGRRKDLVAGTTYLGLGVVTALCGTTSA
ncbi:MAG: LysE family translocator [Ilumatobacteraceae bacterium]